MLTKEAEIATKFYINSRYPELLKESRANTYGIPVELCDSFEEGAREYFIKAAEGGGIMDSITGAGSAVADAFGDFKERHADTIDEFKEKSQFDRWGKGAGIGSVIGLLYSLMTRRKGTGFLSSLIRSLSYGALGAGIGGIGQHGYRSISNQATESDLDALERPDTKLSVDTPIGEELAKTPSWNIYENATPDLKERAATQVAKEYSEKRNIPTGLDRLFRQYFSGSYNPNSDKPGVNPRSVFGFRL